MDTKAKEHQEIGGSTASAEMLHNEVTTCKMAMEKTKDQQQ